MTPSTRLLLLGGTVEARRLAEALSDREDVTVITSLAGLTTRPVTPPGAHRFGGFGGADGLAAYLDSEEIAAVVDATHPFAASMRWHAFDACNRTGVPRLRLERRGWEAQPGDRWSVVADLAAAAETIASGRARRVFLTIGRRDLDAFVPAVDGERWWLIRSIELPENLRLNPAEVILDRGPFEVDAEAELMERHRIDLLVTKNSGGDAASAKLEAARLLGVEVLIADRPPSPDGPSVTTVGEAVVWLCGVLRAGSSPGRDLGIAARGVDAEPGPPGQGDSPRL